MDFLKEIVKEIGDEYTQLASEAESTETFIDTGSYIFNGFVSGLYLVVYLGTRLPLLLVKSSTGKTFFSSLSLKIFLTITLMGIVYILILKALSTGTP